MLYQSAVRAHSGFSLVYSPLVEEQAERHQKPGHVPVSRLRERLGWMIEPDADNVADFNLIDTELSDQPVLAAALACQAQVIITSDVDDFGEEDLMKHMLCAVDPGFFLADRLTETAYRDILVIIAANRGREPRTPKAIHCQEIAAQLPLLFDRFCDVFGPVDASDRRNPPRVTHLGISMSELGFSAAQIS